MDELADGSRDMIASTTGLGHQPARARHRAQGLQGDRRSTACTGSRTRTTWSSRTASPQDKLAVVLDLMKYMLKPEQQAYAYDEGYFYPGPAVKDVPLTMAPAESQKVVEEYGRPEYDKLIETSPERRRR